MNADIARKAAAIVVSLPENVSLVAAAKTRTPDEIKSAMEGGVTAFGHNYTQEAERSIAAVGRAAVAWHMIGHLQRNKAGKAAALFDMVESVDSVRLGLALDRACAAAGRVMPVLIEVNSAVEHSKSGALPDEVEGIARELAGLDHIRIEGLMTLGLFSPDPEQSRPCFRLTRELFDGLSKTGLPGVNMHELSMGMSDSYRVAIEEGATMVRIGSAIFGPR
ncbi:MAG TPA: YggS family pyridoxal phosphate-dependent enzyme [Myxococcota bacterium]|nr:YggS family pyridoxal phosphate-dependent enzyme [Myxococcota bacterium]